MAKATVIEYKDNAGENRIKVIVKNGNLTYASSEGYKNIQDARTTAQNSSIAILKHYKTTLSPAQIEEINQILKTE